MAAPPPAGRPRRPTELMDKLVEEILLRLRPDNPACLVSAALVCKRWCRVVMDPGFRRRYRQFHRTPPLLGFIVGGYSGGSHFLPCSSFHPPDAAADCGSWSPLDARHGRILLFQHYQDDTTDRLGRNKAVAVAGAGAPLIVWIPATGEVRRLPLPPRFHGSPNAYWNAALLCVAPGCDHLECPSGAPFNVILVGSRNTSSDRYTHAYVYSSEADEWSETASVEKRGNVQRCSCNALVGNAIYFLQHRNVGIVEYDLVRKELSVIDELPPICDESTIIELMSVDDGGGLGFAVVRDFRLWIWLRESAPTTRGGWTWTVHKVFDLKSFPALSKLTLASSYIVAAADAVGVFVIWACGVGVVAIDVKADRVWRIFHNSVVNIIPYISFCTPALRAATNKSGTLRADATSNA